MSAPVIYNAAGRPYPLSTAVKKSRGQARAFMAGFVGANDEKLSDWVTLPLDINTILRNDLAKLRARSRDLARNDDTCKRFLAILKQNVLGHAGIKLQAKNKLANGKQDAKWNAEIEREWPLFLQKRRWRGQSTSPSACGQLTGRELAWLSLWTRAIDGECFIQILRGYPHNKHRFAVRFLNPDLLDSGYCVEQKNGNRVEMGIEFDEFDRPVAYHFSEQHPNRKFTSKNKRRRRIPASQIIHLFRHEFVGQVRGIPDFAGIMQKTKMLGGVHEAIVVGWRVAAAKMGFFTARDPELLQDDEDGNAPGFDPSTIEATPGSFDVIPDSLALQTFDAEYPTSTYESGHKVFMQQLANGLNVSSPTLSNNYSDVNYSSLRQALLEDREGWRCIQAEMIDGFYQPLFDEWYDWSVHVTGRIQVVDSKRYLDPVIAWQPRGWPWVEPLREVKAHREAVDGKFRTRQSVMAETSGADFTETVDELAAEDEALKERGLLPADPAETSAGSAQDSGAVPPGDAAAAGKGEVVGKERADAMRTIFDAYGVGVRAGGLTPQPEDEEFFREMMNLGEMSEDVQNAWKEDGGARRSITLKSQVEFDAETDASIENSDEKGSDEEDNQ